MENGETVLSCAAPRRASGFSLIEVLIAAAILLIVALGVLPLFTQSITNNQAGNDYTQATNHAKSELERLYEMPFNSPELTVVGTATTRVQHFSQNTHEWIDGAAPAGETPLWVRTTTIRQFGLAGLVDANEDGYFDSPLSGGTVSTFVHVKEIDVRVNAGRSDFNLLGAGKRVALRTLKPF
jgi:prepilin-type N-terminal cleavage/methylation domain-containing protein